MQVVNTVHFVPATLTKRKEEVATPSETSWRVKAREDNIDIDVFEQEAEKLDKEIQQVINDIRPKDLGAQALDIKHVFTKGEQTIKIIVELIVLSEKYKLEDIPTLKRAFSTGGPQFISTTNFEANILNLIVV